MLDRTLGRLLRRVVKGGVVLCGHGIAERPEDAEIHLAPAELENTVTLARSLGEIVPLTEILMRRDAGKSTAGLIALTFDDGYASLRTALPLLSRQAIPATIFLVSSAVSEGKAFWWDRLQTVLNAATSEAIDHLRRTLALSSSPDRLRDEILVRYKGRASSALDCALTSLETDSGQSANQRPMILSELERLCAQSEVEFGVHTRTHAALPLLDSAEALDEIRRGYRELQQLLPGRVAPLLAIPFGLYDRRTSQLAREAGMEAALSLNNLTLSTSLTSGTVPRISLARRQRGWKLVLKMSGFVDAYQIRRGAGEDPPLPGKPTIQPRI